jgi:outer membrane biosynthesis protein TonB
MREIDEAKDRMLALYRAELEPADAGKASAWNDLQQRLGRDEPAPAEDPHRPVRLRFVLAPLLALAAAGILWLVGRVVLTPDEARAPAAASDQSGPGAPMRTAFRGIVHRRWLHSDPEHGTPDVDLPEPEPAPTVEQEPEVEPKPSPQPTAGKRTPRPPKRKEPTATNERTDKPVASTLREELVLLRQAQRELANGNAGAALAPLETHAERFPRGVLRAERMAKQAVALCKLGRRQAALKMAETVVREQPGSPLAAAVAKICTEDAEEARE